MGVRLCFLRCPVPLGPGPQPVGDLGASPATKEQSGAVAACWAHNDLLAAGLVFDVCFSLHLVPSFLFSLFLYVYGIVFHILSSRDGPVVFWGAVLGADFLLE